MNYQTSCIVCGKTMYRDHPPSANSVYWHSGCKVHDSSQAYQIGKKNAKEDFDPIEEIIDENVLDSYYDGYQRGIREKEELRCQIEFRLRVEEMELQRMQQKWNCVHDYNSTGYCTKCGYYNSDKNEVLKSPGYDPIGEI